MSANIEKHGNAQDRLRITAASFLKRARGYLAALAVLKDHLSDATLPAIGLLGAHTFELALKAYLLKRGSTEAELKTIGHDLELAWAEATSKGFRISGPTPTSLPILSLNHNNPFLFRYPQVGFPVAITPPEVIYLEAKEVVEKVGADIVDAPHS